MILSFIYDKKGGRRFDDLSVLIVFPSWFTQLDVCVCVSSLCPVGICFEGSAPSFSTGIVAYGTIIDKRENVWGENVAAGKLGFLFFLIVLV